LKQLGDTWGQYLDAYSKLIQAYYNVVCAKLDFHHRNPKFPQTLNFKDQLIPVEDNDINGYFQLAVEVFDFQATILKVQQLIFGSMDPSRPATATSVHCRIAPLVPIVEESAALYHMSLTLMRRLHSSLPIETLTGHRERFYKQHTELHKFYFSASNLQYLETLVTVPALPEVSFSNLLHYKTLWCHLFFVLDSTYISSWVSEYQWWRSCTITSTEVIISTDN
jgi:huntingtin interacting protein 1